jgi:acyl-homoserine-lactone acylase
MNKSHTWAEFETAIKMEAIPHFNIIYADKMGNIFYQSGGMYPDRK